MKYVKTPIEEDETIIITPETNYGRNKQLFLELDENEASSFTDFTCYVRGNCLGPESKPSKLFEKVVDPGERKLKILNTKRDIPLHRKNKNVKRSILY